MVAGLTCVWGGGILAHREVRYASVPTNVKYSTDLAFVRTESGNEYKFYRTIIN